MALTDAAVCRAAARKKQNTVRQGSDQTRRDSMQKKKVQRDKKRAGDRPATSQKGAARLKKLQVTDLRGQAGQRPVQPVHYAGSTGFNQDGPGKNWLKAAELKFSSEVQLASSS